MKCWSLSGSGGVVALPLCSVEEHGALPRDTDCLIACCVASRVGGEWAPAVPYTTAYEHSWSHNTVHVDAEVLIPYLRSVARGLLRSYTALLLVAFHAGAADAARIAARSVEAESGRRAAVIVPLEEVARELGVKHVIHGDPVEASMLLACGYEVGGAVVEVSEGEALEAAAEWPEPPTLPPWTPWSLSTPLYRFEGVPASRRLGERALRIAASAIRYAIDELSRVLG